MNTIEFFNVKQKNIRFFNKRNITIGFSFQFVYVLPKLVLSPPPIQRNNLNILVVYISKLKYTSIN